MIQRQDKEKVISQIKEKINLSQGFFIFEYHGLTVEDITGLRRKLKAGGGELKVFKNTLVKKALIGTETEKVIGTDFKGPLACAFGYKDVVAAAKVLIEFEKNEESLKLKAGVLKDKKLLLNDIKQLAKLPSREVLLGKLVGSLASPLRGWVNVLSAVPRNFVFVLKAIEQKKGKA